MCRTDCIACCRDQTRRLHSSFCFQPEMNSWIRCIVSAIPAPAGGSPRGMIRAMTMPPVSPASAEGSAVVMRNKEGKEKDREKRFSFFGKKK